MSSDLFQSYEEDFDACLRLLRSQVDQLSTGSADTREPSDLQGELQNAENCVNVIALYLIAQADGD